jgi:hypothetical protein
MLRRHLHPVERKLKQPPVGLAIAEVAGNDDGVEVAELPESRKARKGWPRLAHSQLGPP